MDESTLLLYCSGSLEASACQAVEDWAAASPANRKLLEQVYYTYRLSRSVEAYQKADVEGALRQFRTQWRRKAFRLHRRKYGAVAAAFVLGLLLSGGMVAALYGRADVYQVQTEPGQRAHVVLPDRTQVWLNSSTQLRYRAGLWRGERKAQLEGEAYFEVERQGGRPFVVHGQGVRTRVLGTCFNVRSREEEQKVATTLLSGSVRMFRNPDDQEGRLLRPGETLVVDVRTGEDRRLAYSQAEEVLLWRDGRLQFEARTLEEIGQCLEKVYNVQVDFARADLRTKRFTGHFSTDDAIDEILETLSLTQHFGFRREGDRVLILPFAEK